MIDNQQIIRLARAGALYKTISQETGRSLAYISVVVLQAGLRRQRPRTRLSWNDRNEIAAQINAGVKYLAIATQFSVHHSLIARIAATMGHRRPKKHASTDHQQILQMIRDGVLYRVIAERTGTSHQYVSYLALRAGLGRRRKNGS